MKKTYLKTIFHVQKDYIYKFVFIPHFVLIIPHPILNAEQLKNVM